MQCMGYFAMVSIVFMMFTPSPLKTSHLLWTADGYIGSSVLNHLSLDVSDRI